MRSVEIEQLMADLRVENPQSATVTHQDSKMAVLVEDNNRRYLFDAEECRLVLSSTASVERLFEALEYPDEVFVELYDLTLDDQVMAALENSASTVDEL